MNRFLSIASILLTATASAVAAQEADYTQGIIWVNEDWYGHQNSTVNYLMPDDSEGNFWKYRIIQAENPGKELGCTNQYGAIWDDRIYLIAKQDKDPGATITGGRITVADAKTMKILHQQSLIDPSGAQCDGRGFIGVDRHKAYISTSNGVWIFNLDTYTVTGQVEGSANPNAGGDNDKPNTDPTGSLYHGQSGMMVSAAGKIFVAHQQYGLLIVDPAEDKVINVISMDIVQDGAGIGSIVKSKDGFLWLSVAKNCQGTGVALNYIVRLDPSTLDYEIIPVQDGFYAPANSWYAWTPDAFVASSVQNCLYWKGGRNRWFTGAKIYKFDCDTRELSLFVDLEEEGADWKLYGCAIGVHPLTDDIYMALYHEFGTPTYITRRYSPQGDIVRDYDMIENYWFPSLPIFPQGSGNSGVYDICKDASSPSGNLYTVNGLLVQKSVDYGAWAGLSPGIYIWRSGDLTKKVIIR